MSLSMYSCIFAAALFGSCVGEVNVRVASRGYGETEKKKARENVGNRLPLIPYPAKVERDTNAPMLDVSRDVVVRVSGIDKTDLAAQILQDHVLKATKIASLAEVEHHDSSGSQKTLAIRRLSKPISQINLELVPDSSGSEEKYNLNIGDGQIHLSAPAAAGLFYGVQTLRQLASGDGAPKFPQVRIEDEPRFSWRGLHLDVSRHFFTATQVKTLLDTMGMFKLNRFHWHLTDDQGWRLPVEGYPKLTEIGAQGVDGTHSYTADEIRDVVAYARARHIEVLPEVDVPGHVAAALAAYPELGNDDSTGRVAPRSPEHTWGVHEHTLAPTKATDEFLKKVYGTITDLFPAAWVHIGGDETVTDEWQHSAHARTAAEKLGTDARHLQKHFNSEVGNFLQQKGRTAIAWDEAQHVGGLSDDAIVMAWRSSNEARVAASAGKKVIVADSGVYYFDHYQGPQWKEPKAIGGHTSLQQVYDYEPIPADFTEDMKKQVMGGQGELWSEYFPNFRQVEYMAFPRSIALAERLWTPQDDIVSFSDFSRRLHTRVKDLDQLDVVYRHLTDGQD